MMALLNNARPEKNKADIQVCHNPTMMEVNQHLAVPSMQGVRVDQRVYPPRADQRVYPKDHPFSLKDMRVCLILILLAFPSCNLINPQEDIPSYIRIDSFHLTTDYPIEGSASHFVTDGWVYAD